MSVFTNALARPSAAGGDENYRHLLVVMVLTKCPKSHIHGYRKTRATVVGRKCIPTLYALDLPALVGRRPRKLRELALKILASSCIIIRVIKLWLTSFMSGVRSQGRGCLSGTTRGRKTRFPKAQYNLSEATMMRTVMTQSSA